MKFGIIYIFSIVLYCKIACFTRVDSFNSGYDSATSCNPSRTGRAHTLAAIPCDLTIHNYCNLPGTAYPWHAVRRFVHENQGLMRRMYGDQRHISVLRAEIENNGLELEPSDDDKQQATARYSRQGFVKTDEYKVLHLKNGNEVFTVPHFRPTTQGPVKKYMKETPDNNVLKETSKLKPIEEENPSITILKTQQSLNHIEPEMIDISIEDAIKSSIETNSIYVNLTSPEIQDNDLTLSESKIKEEVISTSLKAVIPLESVSTTENDVETTTESWQADTVTQTAKFPEETTVFTEEEDLLNDEAVKEDEKIKEDDERIQEDEESIKELEKPLINVEPSEGDSKHSGFLKESVGTMEGQLFQDVAAEESAPPVMKLRGVNACPVKEEVVAPFWANNTRGEVLALLNLYPFEQYVHWEKCSHEHKQMFCRDGCRCEQQYRLHRLLAYDPHNECRGIFSDWFKFPSCCVCKCYDMPIEFRVTSRSPRSPVTFSETDQDPNVQRDLYKHATETWYNPISLDDT